MGFSLRKRHSRNTKSSARDLKLFDLSSDREVSDGLFSELIRNSKNAISSANDLKFLPLLVSTSDDVSTGVIGWTDPGGAVAAGSAGAGGVDPLLLGPAGSVRPGLVGAIAAAIGP